MPLHPKTCSGLYSISCLLDALDGYAARHFEQSTRFGAVLDMVTDRCTTSCLLVFLASAWPRWALIFQGLISLDLASHYIHMYATLSMGGSDQSHKKVDASRSKILNLYYTNKVCGPLFFKFTWMLRINRLFYSSAALSMKLSSLRYTFYPSPHLTSPPPSSKLRKTATRPQHFNPEVLPDPYHHSFSPIRTALRHWNWHAQTRWTRSCHGSLLVSVSR
jgi:CDP-diacylglycerol--inositol 3-phosphatidyltransferase